MAGVLLLAAWTGVGLAQVPADAPAMQAPGQHPPPPGHRPRPPPGDHPPPPGHFPPPPPPPPPPRFPPPEATAHEATPITVIRALPEPATPAAMATPVDPAASHADPFEIPHAPGVSSPALPAVGSAPLAADAAVSMSAGGGNTATDAPLPGEDAPHGLLSAWPWLAALSLALLAWWVASRRSHRLARETEQLSRQQRQLRSAHEQLRQQSAHLRNLSIHDPLTGTLNRQAFASELRELMDHLSRFGRPLNLIVFDLDHFKSINDQCGHLAGDAALKLVVGIVREHLVSADLFGRFGGDEFLIACADQSLESCAQLADTVRAAVERKAPLHTPALPGLTLSLGVAQANPEAGYLPDELFSRADAALYEAKRQGRNRVVTRDATAVVEPAPGHRHL
ncbi:GGDEF domain-containing protein [Agrilutibacter solisilvae]|uniref:diguanylate cyclase n=1 Tax=Agrilutibacter solisilvae TaxID=2763317 RepID=A0A975ARF1_9GAMM|nr:GGDEF domain-containing protein [Lysobacter solisilvae]QSX77809.1 diguanylate cyclase [Lysobacter solisilvae]